MSDHRFPHPIVPHHETMVKSTVERFFEAQKPPKPEPKTLKFVFARLPNEARQSRCRSKPHAQCADHARFGASDIRGDTTAIVFDICDLSVFLSQYFGVFPLFPLLQAFSGASGPHPLFSCLFGVSLGFSGPVNERKTGCKNLSGQNGPDRTISRSKPRGRLEFEPKKTHAF